MLNFSAELEYQVSGNGSAKVRERKIADNCAATVMEVQNYFDTLPIDTPIDSVQCYRLMGDIRRQEIGSEITSIPSSSRRRLTISGQGHSKLQLFPGPNVFVIEYDRSSFYFKKNKVYAFYFHHSLPRIAELRGKIIPKTITCKIEKPFSRFLYYYSLSYIHPPVNYDESVEKDFGKYIDLQFKFDLTEDNQYFNTIFITKELRILNLLTGTVSLLWKLLKTKFGGKMKFTPPRKLIDIVGPNYNIEGDKNALISGLGVANSIKDDDLCFAENDIFFQKVLRTSCKAIITKKSIFSKAAEKNTEKAFVITDNPSKLFAAIIRGIYESQNKDAIYFPVDPKFLNTNSKVAVDSFLPDNLELGGNCIIYPQVFIDKAVRIGDSVIVMPGVKIFSGTTIGNNVIIHSNAVIGNSPNWHYRDNDIWNDLNGIGGVVIGNNVFIGANVTIDKGLVENTIIRDNVKIGNQVQVGHGVQIEDNVLIVSQSGNCRWRIHWKEFHHFRAKRYQ